MFKYLSENVLKYIFIYFNTYASSVFDTVGALNFRGLENAVI